MKKALFCLIFFMILSLLFTNLYATCVFDYADKDIFLYVHRTNESDDIVTIRIYDIDKEKWEISSCPYGERILVITEGKDGGDGKDGKCEDDDDRDYRPDSDRPGMDHHHHSHSSSKHGEDGRNGSRGGDISLYFEEIELLSYVSLYQRGGHGGNGGCGCDHGKSGGDGKDGSYGELFLFPDPGDFVNKITYYEEFDLRQLEKNARLSVIAPFFNKMPGNLWMNPYSQIQEVAYLFIEHVSIIINFSGLENLSNLRKKQKIYLKLPILSDLSNFENLLKIDVKKKSRLFELVFDVEFDQTSTDIWTYNVHFQKLLRKGKEIFGSSPI
ncbi:MAG: hypothetical protein ABIA04_10345 [Pseudomonadota bacterium]